ncbi:MAG TPA: PAS domain S-box protein, partial [Syntrophales bacterium]|nr:PAS domain S-box protein [Syntrophales bacterium]
MNEKAKILIVVDECDTASDMRYKLESLGYNVPAIASSGKDAIRKAQELAPDLILMDTVLSGEMDGVEAANRIRSRFDIPVVYVTAHVSDTKLEEISRSKPFGCLFKPFEDMELQAVVKMALCRYAMGKSLRESEAKLHREMAFSNTLIQASPIFFVAIDGDGKTIMMNDSMLSSLGYTADDVAGKDYIRSFVPETDRERMSGVLQQLITCHEPTVNENRLLTKDGRVLLVEWRGRSIFNEQGIFEYLFGIGVDITERRLMEEKLKESQKMFRLITENMKDLVLMVDMNGSIQYSAPSLKDILGYEPKEWLGRSSFEIIHPEDIERVQAIFVNAVTTATSAKGKYRVKHADGHYVWVEALGDFMFDDDGQAVGVILNIRDITEHKQAEEKLQESEERYRTIIESMEDGYYEVDLDGTFTFFNETMRSILGFSTVELMDLNYRDYTSPSTAAKIFRTFNETYRTGRADEVKDYEIVRKDGSRKTLEINVSLMKDKRGDPAGFRGIARDVTNRKEMERELERRFQYLEGVLEAAPSAIIALDRFHHVLRWNPGAENLFGYSQKEVIGRELDGLVAYGSAETMHEARRATMSILSGKPLPPWETVRFRKDGSPVHVTAGGSVILVDGRMIGGVAIYNDISARKCAEEEIRSHQEHLALINQILRHDITNDLVVIQSAINLYQRSPEEEFLEEISSHA